ncbi:MAG: serine/threonine-protein kinase [Deltaproteobacteria bacterium]
MHRPVPVPVLAPRQLVARFELVQELGRGGFGAVWRAIDTRDDKPVALKVLRTPRVDASSPNPTPADRFIAEAKLLSSIDHEGVVRVVEIVEDERTGLIAYAMELLIGRDLAQLRDQVEVFVLLEIIARACDTLADLHERGVIHRDIKPANIFVSDSDGTALEDMKVKLIDFGIAKSQALEGPVGRTLTGAFVGTLTTMAPECFRRFMGHPVELTGAVDQWSIGVSLFELITGDRPFRAPSIVQLVTDVLREPAPAMIPLARHRLDPMPPMLHATVARCLAKRPEHRFESMRALARALRNISEDLGAPTQALRLSDIIPHLTRDADVESPTMRIADEWTQSSSDPDTDRVELHTLGDTDDSEITWDKLEALVAVDEEDPSITRPAMRLPSTETLDVSEPSLDVAVLPVREPDAPPARAVSTGPAGFSLWTLLMLLALGAAAAFVLGRVT